MISHEDAVGLLDAWKEGELEAAEAADVEEHVATCERCRAVEEALGGGLKKVMAAPAPAPELLPGVQRKLRLRSKGRFYAETREERGDKRLGPSPWPLAIASIMVLLALAIAYVALGQVGSATSATPGAGTTPNQAPSR